MRLSSASIKSLFQFSTARQQAKIDTTVTMTRGFGGKGKTPRTETPSAPLQPALNLTSSPSDVTITSTDSKSVITSISDSQVSEGLVNPSLPDGKILSTHATEDRSVSANSKKRNRRKAKIDEAQGQGPRAPVVSPDILPLGYSGPMPAPTTSRIGLPITSPEANVGSQSNSRFLAFTEPIKAEETLRQENGKLKRELEEANSLTRGLKEAHLQLGEEVEAWKQKCEGLSEVVKGLRNEVEGIINSRISKYFEKIEKEAKEETKEELKEEEREEEWMDKKAKRVEEKVGESKAKEGKEKKAKVEERKEENRKQKEMAEKVWNKPKGKGKDGEEKEQGKTGVEDKDGKKGEAKETEAELKARHEKSRQSSFEQIEAYRQRKKKEEKRRKRWCNRFHIKLVRTPLPQNNFPHPFLNYAITVF